MGEVPHQLARGRLDLSALPEPVTAMVDQFYARLQREGHGRWDTSSLIELLRDD
mgnify:CR=1 FL=1